MATTSYVSRHRASASHPPTMSDKLPPAEALGPLHGHRYAALLGVLLLFVSEASAGLLSTSSRGLLVVVGVAWILAGLAIEVAQQRGAIWRADR